MVGGAIQLVSRKAADDFHMEAKAGYGRHNDWYLRSRVDTGYIGNFRSARTGRDRA